MEINVLGGRVTRRAFLRGSALGGVGLATAAVIGCGDDDDDEVAAPAATTPAPAAATPTAAATPEPAKEITIRWAGSNPIPTMSPNSTAASESEFHSIYDGLTRQVPQPGGGAEIEPGLAESWESTDSGATWVFKLREAEWSDGTPFTAEDVKWVHDFYKDPESQSRLISRVGTYTGSRVLDDRTIEISTDSDPIFPKREGIVFTLPKHIFTDASIDPEAFMGATPVGTGAYVAENFQQGQKVTLVKSPSGYRAGDIQGVTMVDFNWIGETSTRMAALEGGDIDFALQVPTIDADRVRSFSNMVVVNAPPTTNQAWGLREQAGRRPRHHERPARAAGAQLRARPRGDHRLGLRRPDPAGEGPADHPGRLRAPARLGGDPLRPGQGAAAPHRRRARGRLVDEHRRADPDLAAHQADP